MWRDPRGSGNRIRRVSTSFESWSSNPRNERNTKYGCSPITFTDRFAQTDNRGSLRWVSRGMMGTIHSWTLRFDLLDFNFKPFLLDYVLILRSNSYPDVTKMCKSIDKRIKSWIELKCTILKQNAFHLT